jgi:hypothetical protein
MWIGTGKQHELKGGSSKALKFSVIWAAEHHGKKGGDGICHSTIEGGSNFFVNLINNMEGKSHEKT